jgi:hypothetical protein
MTKTDLIEAYKSCLENGWVHNTREDNIIFDYNYRQKLFNTHLKKIKDHVNNDELNTIHILIGEAPPYYPNDKFPLENHRTYFYDPKNSIHTPYFKEPYNHFIGEVTDWKNKSKEDYLKDLAGCRVMIFDIFPFPIFQTTKNRQRVNRQSVMNTEDILGHNQRKTAFSTFLDSHFCSRLENLLSNFKIEYVNFYLLAPKYTSIQFLSWCYSGDENSKIKKSLRDKLVKFSGLNNIPLNTLKNPIFTKDTRDFIKKISDPDTLIPKLNTHPIFMDNSGNPNFNNFINGMKTNNEFFIKKIEET